MSFNKLETTRLTFDLDESSQLIWLPLSKSFIFLKKCDLWQLCRYMRKSKYISEFTVFISILEDSENKDLNKCTIKVPIDKSGSERARRIAL